MGVFLVFLAYIILIPRNKQVGAKYFTGFVVNV